MLEDKHNSIREICQEGQQGRAAMTEQEQTTEEQLYLDLMGPSDTPVLKEYIDEIANKGLRKYRSIIQWGKKEGQTYYAHILDGVMVLARLFDLPDIVQSDVERRCLLLAFTVHDINKVAGEPKQKYVDIATPETIAAELESLGADSFFSDWRAYLQDIVALAQRHQGHLAVTATGIDRRPQAQLRLNSNDPRRIERLGYLILAADVLALSDSLDETKFKGQFLDHLNAASPQQRYRFITHRVSEYRGVLTNVIHNQIVQAMRAMYPTCLDLLYYPDGVAYLLQLGQAVEWNDAQISDVAQRVVQRVAELQAEQLGQFIKNRPFGIAVDAAAIESGADAARLLGAIYAIAARKRNNAEREQQRENDVRRDLRETLEKGKLTPDVGARIQAVLKEAEILPHSETHLRQGEFITGYRNLIEAHGKALGHPTPDSWRDLYETLSLPVENRPIYDAVNVYRRGFFVVRDLPPRFNDLDALHAHFLSILQQEGSAETESGDVADTAQVTYLTEYLRRIVLVTSATTSRDFAAYLRQYVSSQNRQCCNCSTPLSSQEWMTANVAPSISVQSFSNHLAGGSQRDPKRYICPICRIQFILEKIAWIGHDSKQGLPKTLANGSKKPGYSTFYLHLYPHTYFTQPFLRAWMTELRHLRDRETRAFLINLRQVFRTWQAEGHLGEIPIRETKLNGIAVPFDDAMRNIPVLPINAPGQNYGEQFLLALEKAVVLRHLFGCNVVLSRLPTSPIDAHMVKGVFVDGLPRNLLWLVAGTASACQYEHEANLTIEQVTALEQRLQALHQLRDELTIPGDDRDLVHDLAVAASDDPWRLYLALDRAIEAKVAAEGRNKTRTLAPEMRATILSRTVAPLAQHLIDLNG
jgi:CRISPR-associated protein Csc3